MGNLYKIESHCPGPKMRNQDHKNGEPLSGVDVDCGIAKIKPKKYID